MFTTLLLLTACTGDKNFDECPPNSSGDEACECDAGFYGSLEWDDESTSYSGECLSGLEMAIQTGDPD